MLECKVKNCPRHLIDDTCEINGCLTKSEIIQGNNNLNGLSSIATRSIFSVENCAHKKFVERQPDGTSSKN
jgi:hypothetical protein